jgi:hypothetical protein
LLLDIQNFFMQYSVPQFIDVQDKIIGPMTITQFLYILAGAGTLFVYWLLAPSIQVFLIPAVPTLGLFAALAFAKVNGRNFSAFLWSAIQYVLRPKIRLWRREFQVREVKTDLRSGKKETAAEEVIGKRVSTSRLRHLSQVLDNEHQAMLEMAEAEAAPAEKRDSRGQTAQDREKKLGELLGKR